MDRELFDVAEVPAHLREYFEEVETACGAPWVRISKHHYESIPGGSAMGKGNNRVKAGDLDSMAAGRRFENRAARVTDTLGWASSCGCNAGPPIPQTVLDPFLGSGTTLVAAKHLGRSGVGIELNPEYAEIAERRIKTDTPKWALPDGKRPAPIPDDQLSLFGEDVAS